jgi:NTE family protein
MNEATKSAADAPRHQRPPGYDKKVALVLQGGGALGSYQAGVYEALCESPYMPDWVAGISVGAINAAIIAGNPPAERLGKLRAFWEEVTSPSAAWPSAPGPLREAQRQAGAMSALLFGQPGFFAPHPPVYWLTHTATSYYATDALRRTLERLVDFDRINSGETRLSVGAVDVASGHLVYFDSRDMKLGPEHVMASGALPPGFPPVEIEGGYYWDGGLVSNTPLSYVLEYVPRRSRLIFQVDLFPGRGKPPKNLDEVSEREKDIRYASRSRMVSDTFRAIHDVRHNINELWEKLPESVREEPSARFLYNFGCVTKMDIVHLIYRPDEPQGSHKDYEFSRATMEARWAKGRADAELNLEASPWLAPHPSGVGTRTFDVVHDRLVKRHAAGHPQGYCGSGDSIRDGKT